MRRPKKDLGLIAMGYGDVYVASVNLGANKNHVLKSFVEAEAYNGTSLILAYSPCIAHGIALRNMMDRGKQAMESNYFPVYSYNPELVKEGKNPLNLRNKEAKVDYKEFVKAEGRYKALGLIIKDAEQTEAILDTAAEDAKRRMDHLRRLSEMEY